MNGIERAIERNFRAGERIRVVKGRRSGREGMIEKIEHNIIYVRLDGEAGLLGFTSQYLKNLSIMSV